MSRLGPEFLKEDSRSLLLKHDVSILFWAVHEVSLRGHIFYGMIMQFRNFQAGLAGHLNR